MIHDQIVKLIDGSSKKISIQMVLGNLYPLFQKKKIRIAIQELIENNTLMFVQAFGSTYLQRSFNRPVKISERVVLKPPSLSYQNKPGEIVVNLEPGCSFGSGSHPTSRLSVKAIEYLFNSNLIAESEKSLDIGTGTGILALVTAMFGFQKVVAIDIDSYSLFESQLNVEINHLTYKIDVKSDKLESIHESFDLVTANLRYPTLIDIRTCLSKMINLNGFVVFSGFRSEEFCGLVNQYEAYGFKPMVDFQELDWKSIVFKKININ